MKNMALTGIAYSRAKERKQIFVATSQLDQDQQYDYSGSGRNEQ